MSLMSRFLGTPRLARSPIFLYRIGLGGILGSGLLMLEHTGRKSGEPRQVVLEVSRKESETSLIVASGFGEHSQWYKNLKAHPHCRVWTGWNRAVPARAELLSIEASDEQLEVYQSEHPKRWEHLRTTIEEITGDVPTHIPMVRLRLLVG